MVKRQLEDDGTQPALKSARSTSTSTAHNHAISPAAYQQQQPPPFSRSTNADPSTSSTSTRIPASSKSRELRHKIYRNQLAILNYQCYLLSQKLLSSPSSISDSGSYLSLIADYTRQACRLKSKYCKVYGDVAVFGDGDCGQLGCGQGVSSARSPRIVAGLRGMDVGSVSAGGLHTLALTEKGCVYSFGCNDEGAVGAKVEDEGYQPVKVEGFVPSAFGPNGVGNHPQITSFESRKAKLGEANIVQIVAGETTSLALSEEGDVYMWGSYRDSEGRKFRHIPPPDDNRDFTGRKDMQTLEEDEKEEWYLPPRGNQDWPMHLCLSQKATDISAGDGWAAAIFADETMVTWGIGTHGEMGRKVPTLDKTTSNQVILEEFLTPKPPVWNEVGSSVHRRKVTGISCGAYHLLVLAKETGAGMSVYSCGLNQYGQLGLGDVDTRFELTKIEYLEDRNIAKIEAGYHFSCFVNSTGKELYSCGRSDYGQLGISLKQPDSGSFESTPVRVPLVYDIDSTIVSDPKGNCIIESEIVEEDQPEIEQISCGSTHVLVLTKEGDVYSWGFGESGACGQGKSDSDVLRPKKLVTKVENAQGAKCGVKFVSGGGQHSAVVVATASKE
ncbi:hypothetical protein ACHAWO_013109 [Cyclotella atomus]|uniref:RCC1-like domain-containing protein n=1 Tax=Cyclotella atomus TaxID=382360 RepID=A0ABD3Q6T3_9STRA